ncbi:MAG: FHA domain-containing protein [Acidobacteria bacterium]|nr:FHA domain-containing protein [Acidobacteriota bacterium]
MAKVVVRSGDVEQGIFDLQPEGVTLFGRPHNSAGLEQPDVPLPGKEVSRTQCHVVGRGGTYVIYDGWPGGRASANGTKIQSGSGWVTVSTDEGTGSGLGEGATVVVPANTEMMQGFSLTFFEMPLRDEDTRHVGANQLDEHTKVVNDEGFGLETDMPTDSLRVKSELIVASPVRKDDVLRIAFDRRVEPKAIAFDGKVFDLSVANKASIGRGPENDIHLVEPDRTRARYVSRKHAEIVFHEGEQAYHLVNYSPNATLVNKRRITDQVVLNNGDVVEIGSTALRFRMASKTRRAPWYVRHRSLTRAGLILALLVMIAGLGLFGYSRLMNRMPDRILSHKLWAASQPNGREASSTPAIADLNGDGILDVVYGLQNGVVWAMDGLRGGEIWNRPLREVPKRPGTDRAAPLGPVVGPITVANVDHTGAPEVIVPASSFLVLVEGDTGTIKWYVPSESAGFVGGAAVGDIDGNGVDDIVTVDGSQAVALRGETGGVLWRSKVPVPSTAPPALADFNKDGVLDAVFACRGDGQVKVLDGRDGRQIWASPVFSPPEVAQTAPALSAPAVGDLTGDGIPDVVVMTPDYIVYLLDGQSGSQLREHKMEASMIVPDQISRRPFVTAPVLADLNGDGTLDVCVFNYGNLPGAKNFIYALDGANLDHVLWSFSCGDRVMFSPPALADVTGDGIPEIVASLGPLDRNGNILPGGAVEIIDGRWGRSKCQLTVPMSGDHLPQLEGTPLLADIDGDGRMDVIVPEGSGTIEAIGLNVPVQEDGVAWGMQRGNARGTAVYQSVPRKTERILLAVAVGALLFGLFLGLLSGLFVALARRWTRHGGMLPDV